LRAGDDGFCQYNSTVSPTTSITLPGNKVLLPRPLTPPSSEQRQKPKRRVDEIDLEIENRKTGRGYSSNPWLRFELSPIEYEHWRNRHLDDPFVEYKLRYDYFPFASLFVLRIPRRLHDRLAASIVRYITTAGLDRKRSWSSGIIREEYWA
jgi:hypothetical protein